MSAPTTDLDDFELLAELGEDDRAAVADRLHPTEVAPGTSIVRQGEPPEGFGLIVDGEFEVVRTDGGGETRLATVGPGSIVGELGILSGRPRLATVTCLAPARVLMGDRDALVHLLLCPGVADRMRTLVSQRLAEDAPLVEVSAGGRPLVLRPLRPDDRDAIAAGIHAMSDESLHRRFFTGGHPGNHMIDLLMAVDYVDHFAWVVAEPESLDGLGVARFHRNGDQPAMAEVAFAVRDDQQGRGIGTLMLGALAVAAEAAGIDVFRAEVLEDNRPMRIVLDKVDAHWERVEAGVVATEIPVERAAALLDVVDRARLRRSVEEIVTAAGLALTR